MHRSLAPLVILLAGALFWGAGPSHAQTSYAPRIAFFAFVPLNTEATPLMESIPTIISGAVGRKRTFEVLEKKQVDRAMELQGLKLGAISEKDIYRLGNSLGFDFGVTGTVAKERGMIAAGMKVLDVRSQQVCAEHSIVATEGSLNDKLEELASAVVEGTLRSVNAVDKAPDPPSGLRAIGATGSIKISWSHKEAASMAGFKVFKSGSQEGPFVLQDTTQEMTYTDRSVIRGQSVYYRVKAVNKALLESDFSEVLKAEAVSGPAPPIVLAITPDIKSAHIKFRASPGPEVKSFKALRKKDGDKDFAEVALIPSPAEEYVDKELRDNTTYFYTLVALDPSGHESESSPSFKVTTLQPPLGLKATPGVLRVSLEWQVPQSDTVDGYSIYRASGKNASYDRIATVQGRATNRYVDTLKPGNATEYVYRVSAFNKSGSSTDPSSPASSTPKEKPPVPEGLTAKSGEPRRVSLKWSPVLKAEEEIRGYYVLRSITQSGEYASVARISEPEASTYVDKDQPLKDGATYYYAVASFNSAGIRSDLSEAVPATTKHTPRAPRGLKATEGEVKKVTLTWESNPENDIREYVMLRGTSDKGELRRIGTARKDCSYIDNGLPDGARYAYSVEAVDTDDLQSEPSPSIETTTKFPPKKPKGLKVVIGEGGRSLKWDPNEEKDVKKYNIYKKGFLGTFQLIATVENSSWTLGAAEGSGSMELVVKAQDLAGLEGEASDPLTIEGHQK